MHKHKSQHKDMRVCEYCQELKKKKSTKCTEMEISMSCSFQRTKWSRRLNRLPGTIDAGMGEIQERHRNKSKLR